MSIQIIQSTEDTWDVMTANEVKLGFIWKRGTRFFNRPPYEYLYKSTVGAGRDGRKYGAVYPTFGEAEAAIKSLYEQVARSILS